MPREKVPYGAAECGRAQKDKEIEVKLEKKLETVNNVSGDAAHNLQITGSKGVTVKTDEARHKIALEVDTSELGDVVHTDRSETVTGAKTFAGDQVFTGSVGMSGTVNVTGAVTANNSKNVIKAASHTEVLTGSDVLTAADIMTANGPANNLVHRTAVNKLSAPAGSFVVGSRLVYAPKISTFSTVSQAPWKELVRVEGWGNTSNMEFDAFGSTNGQRSLNHSKWFFTGDVNVNYQGAIICAATVNSDIDIDFIKARINADGTMSIFANMSKSWMSYRYSVASIIREDDNAVSYVLRPDIVDPKDTADIESEGTVFTKITMKVII